jgi:hypothetical protein
MTGTAASAALGLSACATVCMTRAARLLDVEVLELRRMVARVLAREVRRGKRARGVKRGDIVCGLVWLV